ncbi:hypothetical protein, partial [Holdemanella porci]|uniref:hypothetical protein n=1 Tax=Holdemanella porci TaxID=2652276 RepID=UPI003AB5D9A0
HFVKPPSLQFILCKNSVGVAKWTNPSMVKMNGCAAIDFVRPFRFLADKAAVAADFHLRNGAY